MYQRASHILTLLGNITNTIGGFELFTISAIMKFEPSE